MKQCINLKLQPGWAWLAQSQGFIWYIQDVWSIKKKKKFGYTTQRQNNRPSPRQVSLSQKWQEGAVSGFASTVWLVDTLRSQPVLLRLWQCIATSLILLSAHLQTGKIQGQEFLQRREREDIWGFRFTWKREKASRKTAKLGCAERGRGIRRKNRVKRCWWLKAASCS